MQQSSTEPNKQEIVGSHDLREIAEILVKHHNIHEGLFDLAVEFQIVIGAVGIDPSSITPGAMIGVRRIGLMKASVAGSSTVNAAEANPPTKKAVVKKASTK